MGEMDVAKVAMLASLHPYDGRYNDKDLYRQAARVVMAELTSRRGFDLDIDSDTKIEIVDELANILRVLFPQDHSSGPRHGARS